MRPPPDRDPLLAPAGAGVDAALATTTAIRAGAEALREGNATTALALFDHALALTPSSPEAAFRRAVALEALGRAREAIEWARECLEHPEHRDGAGALIERLSSAPPPALDATDGDVAWTPGETVHGRWEVFGSAEGGMGRVYFVRDREWGGLEMAVKTLAPRAAFGPAAIERTRAMFRRESQVWLDLGAHPHIVSGYYTLEVQGALRFFMEYVPGLPLDAVLRAAGARLPTAHAIDLAIQLAAGLEYVHARGVVHRDVKPGNCLVMEDGTLRLTDFGLGKVAAHADAPGESGALSSPGALGISIGGAGTPWYMAPEQWRSLAEAREPADVYALGVVLYELLAGAFPFDTDASLLARYASRLSPPMRRLVQGHRISRELVLWTLHQEVEPLPMRAFANGVPEQIEALALRCLSKSATERPSMREVRGQLLAAYRGVAGVPYARELPGALDPTEAGETNRAISYFVMGESAQAKSILDAWLARDGSALYAWINRRVMAMHAREEHPQGTALAFARTIAPAHPIASTTDRHVAEFARRLSDFAPWTAGPVAAVALSPDGAMIALAIAERVLLIRRDGVHWLDGHGAPVTALAFGAEATLLITASHDRTARVWRVASGETVATFRAHRDSVLAVALSHDGRSALSACGASFRRAERAAWLWNATSATPLHSLRAHRAGAAVVAFSRDGTLAVTGSADGSAALWDVVSGNLLYPFEPPEGRTRARRSARGASAQGGASIVAVSFDPDGRALQLARRDGRIERYEARSGRALGSVGGVAGLSAARALPDGGVLAGYDDGMLRVWDAQGSVKFAVQTSLGPVLGVDADATGTVAVACGESGAQRWRLDGPESLPFGLVIRAPLSAQGILSRARDRHRLLARLDAGDTLAYPELLDLCARTPQYARDEALVARVERALEGRAARAGLRDAWPVASWSATGALRSLAFAPDGERLFALVGGDGGAVVGCWARDGTAMARPGDARITGALALSADGRTVAAVSSGAAPSLRRALDGREIRSFDAPGDVTVFAFGPGGALAASGHGDGCVRVLDLATAKTLRVLRGHRHGVASIAFSHDGRWLVSGGWDGMARVWETETGRCARVLDAPVGGAAVVAFDRASLRVLIGGDGGARMVDTRKGMIAGEFATGGAVTCAALSPDGAWVALGGWDDAVRVFSVPDGALLGALPGHAHGVTAVTFAPDGSAVASAGADGSVRVFRLEATWRMADELAREVEILLDAADDTDHDALLVAWGRACRASRFADGGRIEALRARVGDALRSAPGDTDEPLSDPMARAARVDPLLR